MRTGLIVVGLLCSQLCAQIFSPKQIYEQCVGAVVKITTPNGFGTGFYIHNQYIITNKHVIARTVYDDQTYLRYEKAYFSRTQITVTTRTGVSIPVIEVNAFREHPDIDIALLKVSRHQGVELPIFPNIVDVGEQVITIGHPYGNEWAVTSGSISKNDHEHHVQLDIAIDPGNSGGPVINKYGQVVAVVNSSSLLNIASTIRYGVRSDVLIDLLQYYGIPFSTEPIITPSREELREQFLMLEKRARLLKKEREELDLEWKKLDSVKEDLHKRQRQLEKLEAEISSAKHFLKEYERKHKQILEEQEELKARYQNIIRREQDLNNRELKISEKEAKLYEKLADHFSLELFVSPMYQLRREQLVPLRATAGLHYRFGFRRDKYQTVVTADKVGINATRQLSLLGWEQDEIACSLEFSSLVRIGIGTVLSQRDPITGRSVRPSEPLYTASLLVDLLPEESLNIGVNITGITDRQFRSAEVMVGVQFGLELTFFRW